MNNAESLNNVDSSAMFDIDLLIWWAGSEACSRIVNWR